MVRVDDVQGYRKKFENQQAKLETADIDDRDRKAIQRFVAHLRANDSAVGSLGTVVGHLNRIRLSAERAHMPLVDFEGIDDANALKLHLEDVHGLSEGTIRNYMKAVRKFFLWHLGEDSWADDVTIGPPVQREHDPEENITADELEAMLTAANQFQTPARDRALIAVLRDTGLRIGAVLSLQLKHVNFEARRGTLKINTDANVKGASGAKPVTWSRAHVANLLDVHPRTNDPEAPLFHKSGHYDPDDPEDDGALSQQYAGQRIKMVAEAAGLDPDRIHAHLFRGTTISEWILDQMGDQVIKQRAGWSEDSRMFSTYSRVTEEQFNDAIFDHYGIDPDDAEEERFDITLEECPFCETPLRGSEIYCPRCAAPLSHEASDAMTDVGDATRDYLVDEGDRDKRAVVSEMANAAQDDPAVARALLEELQALADDD